MPSHVLTEAGKMQNTVITYMILNNIDPKFNNNLSSLGMDEDKLKDELADYICTL